MWRLLRAAYAAWDADGGPRMGAALAYYAVFSLAPMLLLAADSAALIVGSDRARLMVLSGAQGFVGPQAAAELNQLLDAASVLPRGAFAEAAGIGALLAGALSAVAELRDAMSRIWRLPPAPSSLRGFLSAQLAAVALAFAMGVLLLASLILSACAAAAGRRLGALLPVPELALHLLNVAASMALITPAFAAAYQFLPRTRRDWRDVWRGAAATALFFALGNVVLGVYLGKSAFASVYGAAGSLVAIMVWIYYTAQILYFGAEFTRVHAEFRRKERSS